MYPSKHLIFSLALIVIFFPVYKYFTFLILITSYFIDIDHYMWYIAKYKDFNLRRAIKKSIEQPGKSRNIIHVFHTMEFVIILTIFCINFKYLHPLIIGLTAHFVLDFIEMFYERGYNNRILSFIELI